MDTRSYGHIANLFIRDILDLTQKKILTDDNEEEWVQRLIQKYVAAFPEKDDLEWYLREAWMRYLASAE